MDADLSHPPEKLPELIAQLQSGAADFAMGSRYVPGGSTEQGWGLGRWLNSKVATLLARPFTTSHDPMSGFFAMKRQQFLQAEALSPIGYKIALELLVKGRCRKLAEIPIHFANRTRGQSKLSLREQWNYLKHVKRLADYKYGKLSHFLQFCFVGGTGMVVDLSSLAGLLHLSVSFYVARAVAIFVAMTWNFWLNRRLTFSYGRGQEPFRQYLRFVATCSVGATVNWSVAVALVDFTGMHKLGAALLGILAGMTFNFLLSLHWVFGKRPKRSS
jgi:dolichol-phosphate mannosyltransferase